MSHQADARGLLRYYGDSVLSTPTTPLETFDTELLESVTQAMCEVMYASNGVGLAANQIGLSSRFFVYDIGDGPQAVFNPELLERSGEVADVEGCLSVPGVAIELQRAEHVTLAATDAAGRPRVLTVSGFEARVFQHEIDHINGILISNYL